MMEAVIALLIGGTVAGLGLFETRRRVLGWQKAVAACNLEVTEIPRGWTPRVEARDGIGIVRIESSGRKGYTTRIVLDALQQPDFHRVEIHTRSSDFLPEIETGDLAFDAEFHVRGPALLVAALLDEEARRLLYLVNTAGRMQVFAGELLADLTDDKVSEVLPLLLDLRKRFAEPLHIPRRLAENAGKDAVPGVRRQNLLLLLRELPQEPETAEALRALRSDPSPEVRLRLALELGGAEGRDLLRTLAAELKDDDASARAVYSLNEDLPFEQARDILVRALGQRCQRTARACLEVLGDRGDAAAVEVLAQVLEREYGDLAPAAARALRAIGSPAAEPALIQALQRDHADLRVAAAEALGRVGSAAAVLPLQEAADRFLLGEIRQAARRAIAEIQSRLRGASPGQLSLAGTEAGQLSLADDPAGRLSIPGEERS